MERWPAHPSVPNAGNTPVTDENIWSICDEGPTARGSGSRLEALIDAGVPYNELCNYQGVGWPEYMWYYKCSSTCVGYGTVPTAHAAHIF